MTSRQKSALRFILDTAKDNRRMIKETCTCCRNGKCTELNGLEAIEILNKFLQKECSNETFECELIEEEQVSE